MHTAQTESKMSSSLAERKEGGCMRQPCSRVLSKIGRINNQETPDLERLPVWSWMQTRTDEARLTP